MFQFVFHTILSGEILIDGQLRIDLDNVENNCLSLHTDIDIKRSLLNETSFFFFIAWEIEIYLHEENQKVCTLWSFEILTLLTLVPVWNALRETK